ncbi:MAG: hypothetical protein IJ746_01425 [Ruminococcus sp.]|nr:hypothetical protein [Ruminococcus sp.]
MKNYIKLMAVIAALCLTACGSSDSSAEEDSGKLTLASSTTTTTAAEDASTTTTTEAEATTTTAETTEAPEETTTEAATEATTTTTAATEAPATTTTTAAPATTTTTTTAAPAPVQTKETKFAVTYNGVTFNIGDSFSAIEQSLGRQAADPQKAQACIGDAPDSTYYYYPQLNIEVNEDKIFSIALEDNFYYGDVTPKTAKGIAPGSKLSDVTAAYGQGEGDDWMATYKDSGMVMTINLFDEEVLSIYIRIDQ